MAILEIDHLVRSVGISILVLFTHAYLMAEKGTEVLVEIDDDEKDKLAGPENVEDEEIVLNSKARLSNTTNVSSTEKRINEIQDDGNSDGEI